MEGQVAGIDVDMIAYSSSSLRDSWDDSLYTGVVDQRNGTVVRASALQLVDLEFNLLVESHQKTFKKWYQQLPCLALGI